MAVLHTACPLDCPDSCSLDVTVEEDRVMRLDGSRVNPLTEGYICSKVHHFPDHMYGRHRIYRPAIRASQKGGGEFEDISWDEAYDRIVERIKETRRQFGSEAILPLSYGGSNGALSHQSTDRRFFHRLKASRLARTVCAAPTTAAATGLYGKMPGVAPSDYHHAQLIVVWGANPSASGIHFAREIQQAQRKGARLVVVDPRRTPLARRADLHLNLRPGTDLPLALAMIHWLFERGHADREFLDRWAHHADELQLRASRWSLAQAANTAGVARSDLERFCRWYAQSSPAVIRCGWGLERNRNGGSAVAAVLALPAVAGKFGVRGGGYTMSNAGAWKLNAERLTDAPEPATRLVNMNHIGRTLLQADPPTKFLFVYNCNPLATLPRQDLVRRGLQREDLFTVVFDQVWTDTAQLADLVLPATTFLEHHDLARGYGAMVLHEVKPLVSPVGESRSNFEVFSELGRRLDLNHDGDVEDPVEYRRRLVDAEVPDGAEQMARNQIVYPRTGFAPVQFVDALPLTADQKIDLVPQSLDEEAPLGLYGYAADPARKEYPLALISPATSRTVSSTFGQLNHRLAQLEIHPEDAVERGITSGHHVRIYNGSGEVICPALVTGNIRPGTVMLPKGLWSHNTLNGNTANVLAPDCLTDIAEGACFNDARVEVSPLCDQ